MPRPPVEIRPSARRELKRYFRFAYPLKTLRADEPPAIQDLRDADASLEVGAALVRQGYEFGGVIFNFERSPHVAVTRLLRPSDLLLLTTRPPLDDDAEDRRPIPRSHTSLELAIFRAVRQHFERSSRSLVRLTQETSAGLAKPDRGEIVFHTYQGSDYKRHRVPRPLGVRAERWQPAGKPKATAAFVVRARLWPNGPTVLNVFGMDARMTLVWSYLVRTRFPHLLACDFAMVEIYPEPLPQHPASLAFADGWRVEVLRPAAAARALAR